MPCVLPLWSGLASLPAGILVGESVRVRIYVYVRVCVHMHACADGAKLRMLPRNPQGDWCPAPGFTFVGRRHVPGELSNYLTQDISKAAPEYLTLGNDMSETLDLMELAFL